MLKRSSTPYTDRVRRTAEACGIPAPILNATGAVYGDTTDNVLSLHVQGETVSLITRRVTGGYSHPLSLCYYSEPKPKARKTSLVSLTPPLSPQPRLKEKQEDRHNEEDRFFTSETIFLGFSTGSIYHGRTIAQCRKRL